MMLTVMGNSGQGIGLGGCWGDYDVTFLNIKGNYSCNSHYRKIQQSDQALENEQCSVKAIPVYTTDKSYGLGTYFVFFT